MSPISKLEAKEILDSRGTPTVCVSCTLQSGVLGTASVPSGASTGKHEAYELRDNDKERYGGKGVLQAVENVNGEIATFLVGKELHQNTLDDALITLDGTHNKNRLGANAILAVSMAFARACASEQGLQLYEHLANLYFKNTEVPRYKMPQPAFNIINGGKHSDSGLSFQEFMIFPEKFKTVREKVDVAHAIIASLENLLVHDGHVVTMGDEGGFAPRLVSNEKALDYIQKAILSAGYSVDDVTLGLDVAATTFFKDGRYALEQTTSTAEEMIQRYESLCTDYNIRSIEDGLQEEDFEGFTTMTERLGGTMNIVGDDLTVTNVALIKKAIAHTSINTLLVKPNQIGTLTETFQAISLAQEHDIQIFISHRSGETEDTFIADLAVAVGAEYIKAGAPTRKERIVKYNRLIEIEDRMTT